jgi:hypothetical protein
MLEHLYSLGDAVDRLLSYAYPSVDVTPVLLVSHPEQRARRMTELSGAIIIIGLELLAAVHSPMPFPCTLCRDGEGTRRNFSGDSPH